MTPPVFAAMIFAAMTMVATTSSAQQVFDQRNDLSCPNVANARPAVAMPFRGPPPELEMATQLNAVELIIGITADQQPVWRSYTTAFLNFMEPSIENGTQPPSSVSTVTPTAFPEEKIADLAISKAEAAKAFKAAIASLKSTLHPEQLQKLAQVTLPPPLDHKPSASVQRNELDQMPPPREGRKGAFDGPLTSDCPYFGDPG